MTIRGVLFPAFLFVLFASALFAFPLATVQAQLVPQCVLSGGLGCQACDLFILMNNLIQFAIYLAVTIATVLFMYAGYLYVVSGGSEENVSKAKTIFKDVFFGIVLALLGFAIIDTIVKTVAAGEFSGSWNRLTCVGTNTPGGRQVGGVGLIFTNPNGNTAISPEGLLQTDRPEYTSVISSGGCSVSEMEGKFPGNGDIMSCVCARESTGGNVGSGIDVMWNVPIDSMPAEYRNQLEAWQSSGAMRFSATGFMPFSWGVFQINLAAHDITCNGRTLPCTQAFANQSLEPRDWTSFIPRGVSPDVLRRSPQAVGALGYGKKVTDWGLFSQCVNAALDRSCNLEYASRIAQGVGIAGPWSTSYTACRDQLRR